MGVLDGGGDWAVVAGGGRGGTFGGRGGVELPLGWVLRAAAAAIVALA